MEKLNFLDIRETQEQGQTFNDVVGENWRWIDIYPYRIVNEDFSYTMFKPDTLSLIQITNNFDSKIYNNIEIKKDRYGNNYFRALVETEIFAELDEHSLKSAIGSRIRKVINFSCITNDWNVAAETQNYVFFTSPFSPESYSKEQQQAYIVTNTKFTPNFETYNIGINVNNTNRFLEMQFEDIRIFEETFPNSTILFTTRNVASNDGISIDINTTSLLPIGGIKLKGMYHNQLRTPDGHLIPGKGPSIYGDIDVKSNIPLVPFKMTPTSTNEKVTMYADWFDYDSVLPFVYANKFNNAAGLETVITNEDDRKMVEDMLSISAGFAENWKKAPVLTTGSDAGKIDPTYRVGHKGIKITTIAGMDPIKVVDGIYEDHIREHPAFLTDISRYQPTKEIINALSRYIYSSYSIGKGLNSFNQAYLPWYLEPSVSTPIKYGKAETITNPDYGSTGDVTTYVLNDGIKFQVKTLYFTDKFTDKVPYPGQTTPKLPGKVNLSTQVMLQTDRKLTLPEVPRVISAIDKLPLPGDINTNSSIDLSYIWMLPIKDQAKFEELMLNSLSTHEPIPVGTDVTVNIPTTAPGDIWTQAQADAYALSKVPGTIKTHSVLTQRESPLSTGHTIQTRTGRGGTEIIIDHHSLSGLTGLEPFASDVPLHTFNYILAQFGIHDHGEKYFLIDANGNKIAQGDSGVLNGTFRLVTYYTEFTPTVVTTTSATGATSYSFQGREVLFDKFQWERFLHGFNLVNRGAATITLTAKDESVVIERVNEIIITSMWADWIILHLGNGFKLRLALLNKDDETITIQRVLLV